MYRRLNTMATKENYETVDCKDIGEVDLRRIVDNYIEDFASTFFKRHISEHNNPKGTLNKKINNPFIINKEFQLMGALSRSLDSSLGNMLEDMVEEIASINYEVYKGVEGHMSEKQTTYIAKLLKEYKEHLRKPSISDYDKIIEYNIKDTPITSHICDFHLVDKTTGEHLLIELKLGGDLDNKKALAEKSALLEQYCLLGNSLGSKKNISLYFATAYNTFGEDNKWKQSRVLQFFSNEELLIGKNFWNKISKRHDGFDIIIDEYNKKYYLIEEALNKIKKKYLSN